MILRLCVSLSMLVVACSSAEPHPATSATTDPAPAAPVASAPAPLASAPAPLASAATAPSCGSRGMAACPAAQFCNFPLTAHCGETDAPGACAPKPEMCTKIWQPVCGCDGKTYGSGCAAASAGISVAAAGECTKK